MDYLVSLIVEKKPGSIARVLGALPRIGLEFQRHCVYRGDSQGCRLCVVADGTAGKVEQLPAKLQAIDSVITVVDAGEQDGAPLPEEWSDPPVVNEMVWAYPEIGPYLEQVEGQLVSEEKEHQLTRLGFQVGSRFGKHNATLAAALTLEEAVVGAVIPVLRPLALARADGSNVRVTGHKLLRANLDMIYVSYGRQPRRCFFLTGFIAGILRPAPHLRRPRVTETQCREAGDASCYFDIELS